MEESTSFKIGKTVFGIAALAWGGLLFLKGLSVALFFSRYSSFLPALDSTSSNFDPRTVLLTILLPPWFFALYVVVAGIGVMLGKKWGRKALMGLSIFLIIQPLIIFLVFGAFINIIWAIIELTFGVVTLGYFNLEKVAENFSVTSQELRKQRWQYPLAVVILVFLFIGGYLFLVFSQNLQQFWQPVTINKVNYQKFTAFSSEAKEELVLVDQHRILVPARLRLQITKENLDDPEFKSMLIKNSDASVAMLINNQPIFYLVGVFGQTLGYDKPLIFGKKFLKERVGLLFLIMKKAFGTIFAESEFEEIHFDNWQGLLVKHKSNEGKMIYDYSLWREKKPLGIVVIVTNNTITEEEVAAMIVSLSEKDNIKD